MSELKNLYALTAKSRLIYSKEIETAYKIAVENAINQNALETGSYGEVCDYIWGVNYNENYLYRMVSGINAPNYAILEFIKDFAGEKYNYTFLSPTDLKQSAASKLKLNTDGSVSLSGGKAFSYDGMEAEMVCIEFFNFLEKKINGVIDREVLFADYVNETLKKAQEDDPLFFDYTPLQLRLVYQNLKMVNILTDYDWDLVQKVPQEIWDSINCLNPEILKCANKSCNAQYFIRMRDCEEHCMEPVDCEISGYKLEFIRSIPNLTAKKWDIMIELVALRELNIGLYKEVLNLILQMLTVCKYSDIF